MIVASVFLCLLMISCVIFVSMLGAFLASLPRARASALALALCLAFVTVGAQAPDTVRIPSLICPLVLVAMACLVALLRPRSQAGSRSGPLN